MCQNDRKQNANLFSKLGSVVLFILLKMGIKGLKTYITQTQKEISERINIIEEVQQWSLSVQCSLMYRH